MDHFRPKLGLAADEEEVGTLFDYEGLVFLKGVGPCLIRQVSSLLIPIPKGEGGIER